MGIKKVWESTLWAWHNREDIAKLKNEIVDVKELIEQTGEDETVTPDEMRQILGEVTEVFEVIIDLLDKENDKITGEER